MGHFVVVSFKCPSFEEAMEMGMNQVNRLIKGDTVYVLNEVSSFADPRERLRFPDINERYYQGSYEEAWKFLHLVVNQA